jgi:hypothetical protein
MIHYYIVILYNNNSIIIFILAHLQYHQPNSDHQIRLVFHLNQASKILYTRVNQGIKVKCKCCTRRRRREKIINVSILLFKKLLVFLYPFLKKYLTKSKLIKKKKNSHLLNNISR